MLLRRLLAVLAVTLLSVLSTGPTAARAAVPACTGVWVVVQSDETKPDSARVSCATAFGTGTAALASAGFTAELKGGMLTRINGLPKDADFSSNGNYYWSYWKTTVAADGSLGAWEYYTVSPDASTPTKGSAEGWLLTNRQDAKGPALTSVADATPAETTPATAAPTAPATGTNVGAIVGGAAVILALLALGGWWLVKGRRR